MSSPITVQRSSSPVSTGASGSPSSSPSMGGLYVPLHRRSASSSTTTSKASSSHVSSPTKWHMSSTNVMLANAPIITHPRVYSISSLLSMRPSTTNGQTFDVLMKEKISAACPEVLMTSYIRKKIAFNARRARKAIPTHTPVTLALAPVAAPAPTPVPTSTTNSAPTTQRVTPRRARPSGRGPERRRAALQANDNWRGLSGSVVHASVTVL